MSTPVLTYTKKTRKTKVRAGRDTGAQLLTADSARMPLMVLWRRVRKYRPLVVRYRFLVGYQVCKVYHIALIFWQRAFSFTLD